MAQNSRPVFRSPSLEQETVEELSRRLLEITAQLNASIAPCNTCNRNVRKCWPISPMICGLPSLPSAVPWIILLPDSLCLHRISKVPHPDRSPDWTLEHLIRDMYELFTLEDPSHAFPFRNWMPRPFWKNISIPHFRTATMPVIFSVYLYRRISMPPFLQIPEN